MWKKCKVVRLTTEDVTNVAFVNWGTHNVPHWNFSYNPKGFTADEIYYHLYILSDDEIKVGDLYYHPKKNAVYGYFYSNKTESYPNITNCKKIIASTDSSLNLPRPSDDFIKEYCEKGGINEVMIEFEEIITHWDYDYRCVCGASLHIGNDEMKCDECGSYKITKDKYPSKSYFQPKVAPDNTVTIKKVKDSWSREEIENFILQKLDIFYMNVESKNHRLPLEEEIKDFLRENL